MTQWRARGPADSGPTARGRRRRRPVPPRDPAGSPASRLEDGAGAGVEGRGAAPDGRAVAVEAPDGAAHADAGARDLRRRVVDPEAGRVQVRIAQAVGAVLDGRDEGAGGARAIGDGRDVELRRGRAQRLVGRGRRAERRRDGAPRIAAGHDQRHEAIVGAGDDAIVGEARLRPGRLGAPGCPRPASARARCSTCSRAPTDRRRRAGRCGARHRRRRRSRRRRPGR